MTEMTIFARASRLKLRYSSSQGPLNTEDLWDLPLTSKTGRANLDDIARMYSRELKSQEEESFVVKPAAKDTVLELGFEIVKRIITIRMEENEASKNSIMRKKEREKLMEIIARKEEEALGDTDIADLKKRVAELA
jgi:hypothetical protein